MIHPLRPVVLLGCGILFALASPFMVVLFFVALAEGQALDDALASGNYCEQPGSSGCISRFEATLEGPFRGGRGSTSWGVTSTDGPTLPRFGAFDDERLLPYSGRTVTVLWAPDHATAVELPSGAIVRTDRVGSGGAALAALLFVCSGGMGASAILWGRRLKARTGSWTVAPSDWSPLAWRRRRRT